MIEINKKSECCGCGACVQSCPKKCINICEDFEGFLYPKVSKQFCIECGLCEAACPVVNDKNSNSGFLKTYVAFAKDLDIRMNSSSGGLFSILANNILNSGGMVFGAAFNREMMACHIGISDKNELNKLQGSKYVQSYTGNCYHDAKKALDSGKYVLFSGTACQISGLKRYLKIDYEKLITVDILCHGVPSPKVWRKYLNEQENLYDAKASNVNFRKKSHGWKAFSIYISFDNGTHYEQIYTDDRYMTFFLRNLSLRPSCYKCHFKDLDRESDITIGDCWGIEKYMPQMDDDNGTSVVLIHSDKGLAFFKHISEELELCMAETERALPQTSDSRKSVAMHYNRDRFFKALNKGKSTTYLLKYTEDTLDRKLKSMIKKFFDQLKYKIK